jgi:20S proteasome alpha/beta subunit
MTRAIPFTVASLARAIKGVEQAGRFVVGVRLADGTLIIADKPVDMASLEQRRDITSGETSEDLRKLL